MRSHYLTFRRQPETYAVCRLPPASPIPDWALRGSFHSITKTADELSIVCSESNVPNDIKSESSWIALKLEGPFPFSLTGILSSFLKPLADHGIPVFAISTFDTDYVFIQQDTLNPALEALSAAGHHLLDN